MLLNDFYHIVSFESRENAVMATVSFNRDHAIFKGHFPGHPVVPGVCMMQIVRELLQHKTNERLRITAGDNMKFLSIINPEEQSEVDVELTYSKEERYSVIATIKSGSVTFFKFKGTLETV